MKKLSNFVNVGTIGVVSDVFGKKWKALGENAPKKMRVCLSN